MRIYILAGLVLALTSTTALAHGKKKHGEDKAPEREMVSTEFGVTGNPQAVSRTFTLTMSDEMTFTPNAFTVNAGDTVKFVVKNGGEELHEMVIGRTEDLKKHAAMMVKFPGMEHEDPYMTHVDPSQNGEIIWTFSKAGAFEFGCLIPGHFDAGMRGTIVVH